jgi:hypothetical protein
VRLEGFARPGERRRVARALRVATAAVRGFEGRHGPLREGVTIRLAQVPLAVALAVPAQDTVLVATAYGKVFAWLRPFHDRQVAFAVYQALWRHHLGARGVAVPQWQVAALAAVETDASPLLDAPPGFEQVVRRFGFIPIVDEFLYSGRVPRRAAFQQRFAYVEEPGDMNRLPALGLDGARIARKLAPLVPSGTLAASAQAFAADPTAASWPDRLEAASGRDLSRYLAEWVEAPRAVDYGVAGVRRSRVGEEIETTVRLTARARDGRPLDAPAEPVPVTVTLRGGETRTEVVEPAGDMPVTFRTSRRTSVVEVDAEAATEDRWRADNRKPPPLRVLLTDFSISADIRQGEVEFLAGVTLQRGFGGPVVGASGFRDQESVGVSLGVTQGILTWPAGMRHEIGLGATIERLDPDFGSVRTDVRRIVELGASYGVDSRVEVRNPLSGGTGGVSVTWSDAAIGSEADYVIAEATVTRYLRVGPNRALAFRAELGETLDGHPPFAKGLLLGGFDGLRAYPEEAFGGRSRSLGSIEYRAPIVHDLDSWLAGVVAANALTGVVGLEAGQTSPGPDPFRWSRFRTGLNVGLRFNVRVFGVSPVLWSVDAAVPLEHGPQWADTQVYLSASQSF